MLHRMSVYSAEMILFTLEDQTDKIIHIKDLVQPIPDSTEEQEKILQVSFSLDLGQAKEVSSLCMHAHTSVVFSRVIF